MDWDNALRQVADISRLHPHTCPDAKKVMLELRDAGVPAPKVTPVAKGVVSLSWDTPEGSVQLEPCEIGWVMRCPNTIKLFSGKQ